MNVTINIYGDVHIHCDCCDGSGRYVTDFLVTDYHNYPETENRFYQNTGGAIPAEDYLTA